MNNKFKLILSYLLLFISYMIICITIWAKANFHINNFETILITISLPLEGTDPDIVYRGIKYGIIVPVVLIIVTIITIEILSTLKNENFIKKIFVFIKKKIMTFSLITVVLSIAFACVQFNFLDYVKAQNNKSTIYEEKYKDPRNVNFVFPNNKRNLIFIYLESMEVTFYDKASGGALEKNAIPELYKLSREGICFTDINNQGYYMVPGADYTLGSDVASTSGTNLSSAFINNLIVNKYVLPGTYTLGDVLKDNGYHNVMMIGSPITFGGTNYYYKNHGDYDYKDYQYAIDNNYIPKDYKVFWGYEDKKLFEFAKTELLELANSNQPFNFTLKTIDTHQPGYICEDCDNEYDLDYLNVLSCSSRKVFDFVNWIKQQDFYPNTTVVIMGDHISMDNSITSIIDENYMRKPYFVILNSPIKSINNNRKFSTIDIYPTIIASLGITYDSNRLGLGTNLFSNENTLLEEMGDTFFDELKKSSDFYNNKLVKVN